MGAIQALSEMLNRVGISHKVHPHLPVVRIALSKTNRRVLATWLKINPRLSGRSIAEHLLGWRTSLQGRPEFRGKWIAVHHIPLRSSPRRRQALISHEYGEHFSGITKEEIHLVVKPMVDLTDL